MCLFRILAAPTVNTPFGRLGPLVDRPWTREGTGSALGASETRHECSFVALAWPGADSTANKDQVRCLEITRSKVAGHSNGATRIPVGSRKRDSTAEEWYFHLLRANT